MALGELHSCHCLWEPGLYLSAVGDIERLLGQWQAAPPHELYIYLLGVGYFGGIFGRHETIIGEGYWD